MQSSKTESLSFNEELSRLFEEIKAQQVVEDPFKFKTKLNIGEKAYTFLSAAKNTKGVLELLAAGGAGAFVGYSAFTTSLFTVFGVGFGTVFAGPAVLVACAAAGAGGLGCIKYLYSKADKVLMKKTPKYIKTPIDILGVAVVDIILPPAMYVALSDHEFHANEYGYMLEYFRTEWGVSKEYISHFIETYLKKTIEFNPKEIKASIENISRQFPEVNSKAFTKELLGFVEEIALVDGRLHKSESHALAVLKSQLG